PGGDLLIAVRHRDVRRVAALPKPGEMVRPAVEPLVERAAQIGDRGAEDETRVVQREGCPRLRDELTVDECERFHRWFGEPSPVRGPVMAAVINRPLTGLGSPPQVTPAPRRSSRQ